ncbi:hypothetical protein AVEN_79033-1 [Araneus ventricosus]|uniref:CCHC-type domain-containing protein n=1 Tax=Araneus ventricosus TaxID=182803 RepID=A0A4Y2SQ09_ARAVE|nr:hypothetical protein AVEN_79033-1 [Araneus ventricosus]
MRAQVKILVKLIMEQQVMITHMMGRLSSQGERVPTSYADIIKTPVKTTRVQDRSRSRSKARRVHNVLVVPKKEQNSVETRKLIQAKVSPSKLNIKVNSLKSINKGGIIISAPTNDDIDKLIGEFSKIDDIRQNFDIRKPKLLDPSIIIFNVEETVTKEELLEGLKDQNEELSSANIQVRTSFKSRLGRNWIVSMDPAAFGEIIKKPKINFNWNRLGFKENVRIVQCLKCAKYGHIAINCKNEDLREGPGLCLRCGIKGHKERDCDKDVPNCVNCMNHNLKFKTTHDLKHSARDSCCKIREKELEFQYTRINYGP